MKFTMTGSLSMFRGHKLPVISDAKYSSEAMDRTYPMQPADNSLFAIETVSKYSINPANK